MRKPFLGALRWLLAWFLACVVLFLRLSCRSRVHDDPRPALRRAQRTYAYAVLHAHQLGAVLVPEAGIVAMVSRSADGDLLVPTLTLCGVGAVRGSSRHRGRDKGGVEALEALMARARGGARACFAVDGPRGPRGEVSSGIARLALAADVVVLVTLITASRRFILTRAWDRFQIPKPFATVHLRFAEPIVPCPGDTVEGLRQRVQDTLSALERVHDPEEAARGAEAAARRREKLNREAS